MLVNENPLWIWKIKRCSRSTMKHKGSVSLLSLLQYDRTKDNSSSQFPKISTKIGLKPLITETIGGFWPQLTPHIIIYHPCMHLYIVNIYNQIKHVGKQGHARMVCVSDWSLVLSGRCDHDLDLQQAVQGAWDFGDFGVPWTGEKLLVLSEKYCKCTGYCCNECFTWSSKFLKYFEIFGNSGKIFLRFADSPPFRGFLVRS